MRLRYGLIWTVLVFTAALLLRTFPVSAPRGAGAVALPRGLAGAVAAPARADGVSALFTDITGTWTGTWQDTIYFVSGSITMNISSTDGVSYTATGTIDVGQIDPSLGVLNGTASGTVSGTTLTGTFDCTNLGNGSFTLTDAPPANTASGLVGIGSSGSGTVGAPLSFGGFTFTGTIDALAGAMTGTFDFTSPTGGAGTASLARTTTPVRETTWGAIKATYSDE